MSLQNDRSDRRAPVVLSLSLLLTMTFVALTAATIASGAAANPTPLNPTLRSQVAWRYYTANASPAGHSLPLQIQDVVFTDPTSTCRVLTAKFTLLSPTGTPLGTGATCATEQAGCEPVIVGCRQRVKAQLTFNLKGGSLTAQMMLREEWLSDSYLFENDSGRITSSTGAYAQDSGRVRGGGMIALNDAGTTSHLVLVLHLRRR
jgi:hypothetical protein